jgi:hypothetical protein
MSLLIELSPLKLLNVSIFFLKKNNIIMFQKCSNIKLPRETLSLRQKRKTFLKRKKNWAATVIGSSPRAKYIFSIN